ncbi:hypothetical protein Q0M94_24985 (plasmid) [Deinococcus radiomollis]|uniref:hypothetical protein n=1 Tax=Deinococcus radiomollis TaxID=468916 RepID=UPI0038917908
MPVEDLCPIPKGFQGLLLPPGVSISEALSTRLYQLESRSGQTLSADDRVRLSEELASSEH